MELDIALDIIEGVKIKNSLQKECIEENLVEFIVLRIKAVIKQLASKSKNMELLKIICNCIENALPKKAGFDKMSLVMKIFDNLFPLLSDKDKEEIKSNVQYTYDNGLIKRATWWKKNNNKFFFWRKKPDYY